MIERRLGKEPRSRWHIYVPVLRMKTSEWKALCALNSAVRKHCRPLLEFVPEWKPPAPPKEGAKPTKPRSPQTAKAYVQQVLQRAIDGTPAGTESFVDFDHAGPSGVFKGVDLWQEFENVATKHTGLIPVLHLNASAITSARVTKTIPNTGGRLAIRILQSAFNPNTSTAQLSALLKQIKIPPSKVHILFDLKDNPNIITHQDILTFLPTPDAFASITVLSGVFPVDLTQYDSQQVIHSESRLEWTAWRNGHNSTPTNKRLLAFGDYTTQHAHYREAATFRGSVSLRYTIDEFILILRGKQADIDAGIGYEQIHGHCRLLIGGKDFAGAAFSMGDQKIHCWTDPVNGTGNPEQWRIACLTHHITHTVAQLVDPSGSAMTLRQWARTQPPGTCS